jgi:hypothetical protein
VLPVVCGRLLHATGLLVWCTSCNVQIFSCGVLIFSSNKIQQSPHCHIPVKVAVLIFYCTTVWSAVVLFDNISNCEKGSKCLIVMQQLVLSDLALLLGAQKTTDFSTAEEAACSALQQERKASEPTLLQVAMMLCCRQHENKKCSKDDAISKMHLQ